MRCTAPLVLGMLATAAAVTDLQCQIFDETLVCDNEKGRLARAEIRTCSGCQLNHYPEVASFVRDSGQSDRYPQLGINYIDHHNPDLFLFDSDGEEVQRIDLTRLRTLKNIHKLMRLLGFKEKCRDANLDCANWAKSGQCDANPAFMMVSCRKSCKVCAEDATQDEEGPPCTNTASESDCEYWSTMGECTKNEEFMRSGCARSCGFCQVAEHQADDDDDLLLDDDFMKDEL